MPKHKRSEIAPLGMGYEDTWQEKLTRGGLPAGFTQVPQISMLGQGLSIGGLTGSDLKASSGISQALEGSESSALSLRQVGVRGKRLPRYTDGPALWSHYKKNEMVFAAVELKAASSTNPRLMVQRLVGGEDYKEEKGHPMRALMMRPNPTMDEAALARAYFTSLDVQGIFYAELTRSGGRAGLPTGIYPLDPAKVTPIQGEGGIKDYEYKDGSYTVLIPAENMLVKRAYDPQSRYSGLSKVAVCLGSVDADTAQTDYIREFFNNGGVPSGLLKVKGKKLTEAQSSELAAKWARKYGRATGRQHSVAVLDEDADYTKMGANLDELESQNIRAFTESRICMVFGIPPLIIYSYVGLLRATYANLDQAWENYWRGTLTEAYTTYKSWLTQALLTQFVSLDTITSEAIRLEWDMSSVPYLEESQDAKEERATARLLAGGITVNEYRAAIGEQPDPAGDYYIRDANKVAVPFGQLPPVPEAAPAQALEGAKSLALVGDVLGPGSAELKSFATLMAILEGKARGSRLAIERKMQEVVQSHLGADWQAILERVRAAAGGQE